MNSKTNKVSGYYKIVQRCVKDASDMSIHDLKVTERLNIIVVCKQIYIICCLIWIHILVLKEVDQNIV